MAIMVVDKAGGMVEITETKTEVRRVSKPFLEKQIAAMEERLNAMKSELASITTEIDKVQPIKEVA